MTLFEKIKSIYPTLSTQDFQTLIVLQNDSDGSGDYIREWNHKEYKKPTDEQLGAFDVNS